MYANIIDALDEPSEIKLLRLAIPILGLWSMKPLFSDVCVSIDLSLSDANERVRFLAGLPDTWIRSLEVRCFGGGEESEVSPEVQGCLQSIVRSRVLKWVCFNNVNVDVAMELLGGRKVGKKLDVVYIVMLDRETVDDNEANE